MKRIAIQGIKGAFHETAAKKHFGNDIIVLECKTFKDLCDAVKNDLADFAVMAIENTIAGSLLANYTLIRDYQFKILGEIFLNIKMNLMTLPGASLEEIRFVESHPIALQQCQEFLYQNLNVAMNETYDTAGAAKNLSESLRKDLAIIAGEPCAELYQLEIKEKGIETNKQNFTRFLVLANEGSISNPNKSSLSFQLRHKAGSLVEVLTIFQHNEINLTKIQSVPIIGSPYEYNFHIDIEWSDPVKYHKALSEVIRKTSSLSLLGEYEKASYNLNE